MSPLGLLALAAMTSMATIATVVVATVGAGSLMIATFIFTTALVGHFRRKRTS